MDQYWTVFDKNGAVGTRFVEQYWSVFDKNGAVGTLRSRRIDLTIFVKKTTNISPQNADENGHILIWSDFTKNQVLEKPM